MNWVIVPEYISLLFVFIMLFFSRRIKSDFSLKTKFFRLFLWFVLFEIIISILSLIALEQYLFVPDLLNTIIQLIYFAIAPLMSLLFVFYLIAVIWENDARINKFFRIVSIPYALYLPIVITNPFTSVLFDIDNINGFSYGKGFLLTYSIPILYFLAILFVAFIKRSILGPFLKKVMVFFPILSMILLGVQMIFPEIIISSAIAAYALLIMFLFHQKEQEESLIRSEEKYKILFELDSDSLFLIDKETGAIIEANASACNNYGYSRDELLRLRNTDVSAEPEKTEKALREAQDQNILIPIRYHKKKDGTVFPVEISVSILFWDNREFLLVSSRDITERKKAEEALKESEERYTQLVNNTNTGYFSVNEDGIVINANYSYQRLVGASIIDEVIGHNVLEWTLLEEQDNFSNALQLCLRQGYIQNFETIYQRKDGTRINVNINATLVGTSDEKKQIASLCRDISERKKAEEKIKYLSLHDSLTGLFNRAFFEEEVSRLSVDRQLPISIIMGDINGLKLINDGFGHENGDKLIVNIAKILKKCCRKEDIIARVGGDEFCILLPKADKETVQRICDDIYLMCKEEEKNHKDSLQFISISLGSTTRNLANEPLEMIMKEAEAAMYKHKLLESKSLRSSIVSSIISTLRERYIETEEHSQRTQELCQKTGRALGISDSLIDDLKLLAILHDIGKIAISDTLINKKDKLNEDEWEEIKRHCQIGYHITQSTIEFQNISEYILSHHEKWDGTGYPNQLKGEGIPLLSRILSIVDAYDAMINDRPYRKAISQEDAIKEIVKFSGTQFDPRITKIFITEVLRKEWIS